MKRIAATFVLACSTAFAAAPPKALPVVPPAPVVPAPVPADPNAGFIPQPEGPARVTSSSGQFVISGGEQNLRSSIAVLAEQKKRELLDLADLKDEWKIPVNVKLEGKPGDPPPARLFEFGLNYNEKGWDLWLILFAGGGVDQEPERFSRGLMSALLLEQTLRKLPPGPVEPPGLIVPPWLGEGMQEAVDWQAGRSDRRLYASKAELYKLDDLFAVSNSSFNAMDSASRIVFRVAAGAMVLALIDQAPLTTAVAPKKPGVAGEMPKTIEKSKGREGFQRFLGEVSNFHGEMPILMKRCFPDLNLSETSLNKWWKLQIQNIAEPKLTDTMSVEETEAALEDAVKLRFRNAEGVFIQKPLATGWQDFTALKQAERIEAVRPSQDGLVRLSYRSFPSYRPLIKDYQTILADMVSGKTAKTAAEIERLAGIRGTMLAREHQAHDYMDWFEITRARSTSGAFDDYLKLKERLKYETPPRRDPVSTYLDEVQKIYGQPGGRRNEKDGGS